MTLEEIKKAHKTLEDLQRLLTCYRHISSELTEANGIAIQALEKAEKYKHFSFIVTETLVDVSKENISAEYGIRKIREALVEFERSGEE